MALAPLCDIRQLGCKFATIGVIYGCTRGSGNAVSPTFWTEGYRAPTSQDENVNNLLSAAVNRGDLWRLNYDKAVFRPGICLGPRWKSS